MFAKLAYISLKRKCRALKIFTINPIHSYGVYGENSMSMLFEGEDSPYVLAFDGSYAGENLAFDSFEEGTTTGGYV